MARQYAETKRMRLEIYRYPYFDPAKTGESVKEDIVL